MRSIRKDAYTPKIVFLTMHADAELARECFHCGGSAFVAKESSFTELGVAIDSVMANNLYLSPNVAAGLVDVLKDPAAARSEFDVLTSRQREILQLFAEGKTMKEIAAVTESVHAHSRMAQVQNDENARRCRSAELVQHAVRLKLVV